MSDNSDKIVNTCKCGNDSNDFNAVHLHLSIDTLVWPEFLENPAGN